ncbi:MAG: nucleotide sugar dehydrogenase [Solidesulfovibrio sp.]|uniref:nucleotide sugar dehydrogenase n=1 Tax=Solidesulfovibrio sp. TaxID=2910990 RepID=UPI0031598C34
MKDPTSLLIGEDATILEALAQLDASKQRLLLCVDANRTLLGVLADGDIRRALIAGRTLDAPIAGCVNRNPIFISSRAKPREVDLLLTDRVQILPVVDERHRVVGYHSYKHRLDKGPDGLQNVAIFGLGYVGLTLALHLASRGFNVVGYDVNADLVARIRDRQAPFYELRLEAMLEAHVGGNFHVTSTLADVRCDIYIVTVGSPVNPATKKPELGAIARAAADIGGLLSANDLVVLRSTVPVGCNRGTVLPILEQASGLRCGEGFSLAFAPERTAEGLALVELPLNPQIIGGFDKKSVDSASRLFNRLTPSVISVDSLEAAELCKLLDNCFRDHLFAFSNHLAPLAENLGLDLCRLIDAVNYGYTRNAIPKPSPGVGGPCLTKDPYILMDVMARQGLDTSLTLAARRKNEEGPGQVRDKLRNLLWECGKDLAGAVVTVAGMAFKGYPETSDLRGSMSLDIVAALLRENAVVRCYDAVAYPEELRALGLDQVDREGAFRGADAVVFANNHRGFTNWNIAHLAGLMRQPGVIIDCWHIFDPQELKKTRGLVCGGLGND